MHFSGDLTAMNYQGTIYRPPSEAHSILLQVTTGCSHNKCTFCGMYKDSRFSIKSEQQIFDDIHFAARNFRACDRLFLCDGDALILPQKRLVPILQAIQKELPWIQRIGVYANTKSIRMKTEEELAELGSLGLKIAYMGLESGDDVTLKEIQKGADAAEMIAMGKKINSAGIQLSITVLLGIAKKERSAIHAIETGKVLSAIDPKYVGALSLMLTPGTQLFEDHQKGLRVPPSPLEILQELALMIEHTTLSDGYFHANHASNYLPIKAKLPIDKKRTLQQIRQALQGQIGLKPEYLRAL